MIMMPVKEEYALFDLIKNDLEIINGKTVKIMDTFPFKVVITNDLGAAMLWLEENLDLAKYKRGEWTSRYYFKDEEDAVLFKMMWAS